MIKKMVIGITGKLASGKGTITKHIVEHYDAQKTRSSDPLRQTLVLFEIDQSRENLEKLSTFVRHTYGENTIARAVARVLRQSTARIAIFDGMRRLIDVETLRSFEHSLFIYVDVDRDIRYQRCKTRNENIGDAEMLYEKFCEKDDEEPEQQIEALREYADIVIDNGAGMNELMNQIKEKIVPAIERVLSTGE